MRKLLTTLALVALTFVGITTISSPASAVSPTANLFGLNIANQGATSGASDYTQVDGKTYFTATSLSRGTAIWSVDGDITKEPELVYDPFEGSVAGTYQSLYGFQHYLFFNVRNSQQWGEMDSMVYDTRTKVATKLLTTDGNELRPFQYYGTSWTETDGIIYAWGAEGSSYGATSLFRFNPETLNVTKITEAPFTPRSSGGGGTIARPWLEAPSFAVVGNFAYTLSPQPDWFNPDNRIYQYDIVNDTWTGPLKDNGVDMKWARFSGSYNYNGEDGFIAEYATVVPQNPSYWNKAYNYAYMFIHKDGTMTRIGSWSTSDASAGFLNFQGSLYVAYGGSWDNNATFSLIDPSTGALTEKLDVMFPGTGLGKLNWRSSVVIGNTLVFTASIKGVANDGVRMYQWDGVNPATEFTNLYPVTGQKDVDVSYSNGWGATQYQIGAVGNYAILQMNRDESIGAEPYYISLADGSVTLMKNINRGSDGSSPDTSCFISTSGGDWMTANIPMQTATGNGKSVIVSMKPESTYLKYSVIDPGNISYPCGFNYIGQDIYFQAYGNAEQSYGMYKMTPDGTITREGELGWNTGSESFTYGGNYYWLSRGRWGSDLYEYEVATNTVIPLTNTQGSDLGYNAIQDYIHVGNKLYLSGYSGSLGRTTLYSVNLDQPVFTLNVIDDAIRQDYSSFEANSMTRYGNNVLFGSQQNRNGSGAVFKINVADDTISKMFDLSTDPSSSYWVNKITVVGTKIYVVAGDNNNQNLMKYVGGDAASLMPLPSGFKLNCMAPTGGDILVSDDRGNAYFYGNGLSLKKIDYDFSGRTWALCSANATDHGTYLALPEYPYDDQARGLSTEPGYIGPLIPIAVSRLGQPVTEAPAIPLSNNPPSENIAPAPGAPGTPVATSGAGKISLNWTAPTSGGEVLTYFIESTPEGAQCEITGTSAQCIGLDPGTSYTFKVNASNEGGVSTSSASNSAIPGPAAVAPGIPGKPVAVGKDGGATLTWTAPSDGGTPDRYVIVSNPGGAQCTVTGTTADCSGLTNLDKYTFSVAAVNDADVVFSQPSNKVTIGDPATLPPATPIGVTLVAGLNKVTVTVIPDLSEGAPTTYYVQLTDGSSCEITAPELSCTITGLYSGNSVAATVTASNDNGESSSSPRSSYVSIPYPERPGAPSAPIVKPGTHKLTVKVAPPVDGGEPTSYYVQIEPSYNSCWIYAPDKSCDITDLDPNTEYTVYYYAVNDGGWSDQSPSSDPKKPYDVRNTREVTWAPTDTATVPGGGQFYPWANPSTTGASVAYTYEVVGGTANCSFADPTVKVITVTKAGTCEVKVTAEDDAEYEAASTTVTFTFTKRTQSISWVADSNAFIPTWGGWAPANSPSYWGSVSPRYSIVAGAGTTSNCEMFDPAGQGVKVSTPGTCRVRLDVAESDDIEAGSYEFTVTFASNPQTVSWSGATAQLPGSTKYTPETLPTASGAPTFSYAVTGGTSNCSLASSSSPEITVTTAGTCIVEATAAGNGIYEEGKKSATFTFTKLAQSVTWTPTTTVTIPATGIVIPSANPSGLGSPTFSYAVVTGAGTTSNCVIPTASSNQIAVSTAGTCTVKVTAAETSSYASATAQVTFTFSVDSSADVGPAEGDGGSGPKAIPGTGKFVNTNDSSFQLAWDKKNGKLTSQATGIYTGYIEAKITFTKGGVTYTCSAQFGQLKAMPAKTAKDKAAAMKMKTFAGKQFCVDKTKLDPKTTSPSGGLTPANFKKIKPMNKSAAELKQEAAALKALKGFTGEVQIQIIRYRAWPSTMVNLGNWDSKGGKIPALVRNTKVNLG